MSYILGSTGSFSRASTPKTHSWTQRRGSRATKRDRPSTPSANSRDDPACVVRPAEYPQVFPAATLDPGLQQASAPATDEVSRFDDHSLVAYLRAFQPPSHGLGAILGGLQLHHANIGRCQDGGVGSHEPTQSLEVPVVGVHTSFAGQQMERRETQILYGIYWGWFWIVRLYPRGLFPDGNRPWRSRRRTTAR